MVIVGSNENNFEDDYVVKCIGASGRWQVIICILVALNKVAAIWNMMTILFLTPTTDFRCIKFTDNATIGVKNSTCYKNCENYEYYQDVFEETLISEFDLICEREWMASFAQTVLMLGLMLGVSIFGWFSDRFGRRNALILSSTLNAAFMLGAAYAPNYSILATLRFFIGLASGGAVAITPVFTLEIMGPKYREFAVLLSFLPDGLGQCTLVFFAYFTPTWKVYLLLLSIASILLLTLICFMPESPRWLVSNGKADRAVKLLTNVAKFNKRSIDGIQNTVTKAIQELNLKESESQNLHYYDLFRTKKLSIITLSSVTAWFVAGLCFFGLSQYSTALGSNIFIVVLVTAAIEILLAIILLMITKAFRRKPSVISAYVMCAVSMVCLIFVPASTWITTLFGAMGFASAYLSFCLIYIYTTELYPTPMRNMGFSIGSAGSKLGATIAPFIANLKPLWVVPLIFAVSPIIAAFICLLLPETKGQKLRDTVEKNI